VPRRERSLAEKQTAALTLAASRLPAVREHLMRLAGRSRAKMAAEIRAALDTLVDELSAQKIERLVLRSPGGSDRVETFVDADTAARHRAAVELLAVHGMYPSKTTGGSGPVAAAKVEITLRSAERVETIQVVEVPVTT
jgi:hypothetical protein